MSFQRKKTFFFTLRYSIIYNSNILVLVFLLVIADNFGGFYLKSV